jgi:hypothetical protein
VEDGSADETVLGAVLAAAAELASRLRRSGLRTGEIAAIRGGGGSRGKRGHRGVHARRARGEQHGAGRVMARRRPVDWPGTLVRDGERARGLLRGKYARGRPPPAARRQPDGGWRSTPDAAERMLRERNLARVDVLSAVANRHGFSLLELAVGWLLHRGSVACVMAGVTSPEQVRRNAATAEAAPLSAELYAEATRIGRGG